MSAAWQAKALGILQRGDFYIPHPAPTSVIADEDETVNMGLLSVLKTLVLPAIISLILYLLVTYIFVPVWKRYTSRYGQYLPLGTISIQTSSLRHRILDTMVKYLLPSSWRAQFGQDRYAVSAQDGSGSDFDEEEGEELYDVDDHRREALSLDARRGRDEDGRRLSRDLEEGFKDDSEEDYSDDERQGITPAR
ncbi:hypothetical protein BUE80_DR006338 [Diplocarpon rosae]|nr:hypothetical protein BUE80_DR006338 [Diplocarpon rosae]